MKKDNYIIDKELLKTTIMKYVSSNIKELQCVFNSKAKINGSNDTFNCFKLIQKIYNDWSGLKIKKYKSKGNETESYVTTCFDFYEFIREGDKELNVIELMRCDAD